MSRFTFLYDDACPMCQAYTSAFAKTGISDRCVFSEVNLAHWPQLNIQRGRHEIPMRDGQTGEVRYGLDAMTFALATKLPLLAPLLRSTGLMRLLKPLYWLITYNRRTIAGTCAPLAGLDCAPDRHVGWRLTYIVLVLVTLSLIGGPGQLLSLALGFALIFGLYRSADRLDFTGQLSTVALLMSVLCAVLPEGSGAIVAAIIGGWEAARRIW